MKLIFHKGQTYYMDEIIDVISLIPHHTYDVDDPADWERDNDNDLGETVRFKKTVSVSVIISVSN